MKNILFIVTSADKIGIKQVKTGYEFSEVADPYFEFTKKGFNVDFASILGGTPPADGFDIMHENSNQFKKSTGFKRLNFSHRLIDVDMTAYEAIFFPGGLGPLVDMYENAEIKEVIKRVYESNKIVGAVCHGSVALLNIKLSDGSNLLAGKNITSFTKAEEIEKKHILNEVIPFMLDEKLKEENANFSNAKPFEKYVLIDGNLVTGQNPASASGVATEMIKLLEK